MGPRRILRIIAAGYFLLTCLMWLVLGALTIWFRRISLSGDVETPEDWAFVILGCILPYLVGIYFVFSEKLLTR